MSARQRARIKPRTEARALAAEWIDTYRRTDDRWRDTYTEDEAAQIDTALDAFVATLPDPSASLFFRLRAETKED